jgi:hypothetical protein
MWIEARASSPALGNKRQSTPLLVAVRKHPAMVVRLVKAGAGVKAKSTEGATAGRAGRMHAAFVVPVPFRLLQIPRGFPYFDACRIAT